MSSTSEVGHAKNVANLQKLIEQVTIYTLYNPPVENLTVPKLQLLYTTAAAKLPEVEEARNANKNAIVLRQVAFENLKPICTRIINLLDILGLPEGTLDQAKSLNRSIQGTSKKTKSHNRKSKQRTTINQQLNFYFPTILHPAGRKFRNSFTVARNHSCLHTQRRRFEAR